MRDLATGGLCLLLLAGGVLSLGAQALDDWRLRYTSEGALRSVTHGDGLFVAVGELGEIVTSVDGADWAQVESGVSSRLRAVAFGAGRYVSAGDGGVVLSSADGMTWSLCDVGLGVNLLTVAHGGGVFVVAGQGGTMRVSTNGCDWEAVDSGTDVDLVHMIHGGGWFLVPEREGTNLLSEDGVHWGRVSSGTVNKLNTVAHGPGGFLSIDLLARVFESSDGSNWVRRSTVPIFRPYGLAYGNGFFVLSGGTPPLSSRDGLDWAIADVPWFCGGGVAFGEDTFVIVCDQIYQSQTVVYLEALTASVLRLQGPAGRDYRIETTDRVGVGENWVFLETIAVTASPFLWTNTVSFGARRFYRALLLP